jgi:hypothetical protein
MGLERELIDHNKELGHHLFGLSESGSAREVEGGAR